MEILLYSGLGIRSATAFPPIVAFGNKPTSFYNGPRIFRA
jgi:hypothetical protein